MSQGASLFAVQPERLEVGVFAGVEGSIDGV